MIISCAIRYQTLFAKLKRLMGLKTWKTLRKRIPAFSSSTKLSSEGGLSQVWKLLLKIMRPLLETRWNHGTHCCWSVLECYMVSTFFFLLSFQRFRIFFDCLTSLAKSRSRSSKKGKVLMVRFLCTFQVSPKVDRFIAVSSNFLDWSRPLQRKVEINHLSKIFIFVFRELWYCL